MRFEHPEILWLLLFLPAALALFFWWAMRSRRKLVAQFIEARLLAQLTVGISPIRQKMRFAILIAAIILLIVALARPQHGFDLEEVEQRGLDIVAAVDTSKSMLTTDIAPNRLERAKLAALELRQRAGADRMGLVAFAGDAFLECPLTTDDAAFEQSVQALDVNSIPEGGTALAAAINTALTAFKGKDSYKVLVLLTDGEDNESEAGAVEAAQKAAKEGLKIFTIGIGTAAGDLIHVTDANGNSDYVRDEKGNVVKSHLNEKLLRQIAEATRGIYLPLRGADTMDILYERGLAPLPKTEGRARMIRRYHEQFQWPLAAAIVLLLGAMFLPERRREKGKVTGLSKAVAAKVSVMVVAVCALSHSIVASPTDALRDYNAHNYASALQAFDQLSQVHANDMRFVFDAGAAAYRATKYDIALKDFQSAALSPDLKLQQKAFYNLGNTQYRLGEQKFTPDSESLDAMEQAWKEAAKSYAHAVQLNAQDVDAAYNLALVTRQIESIRQLRDAMLRAKQSADEAVRRDEFHRALEIMESMKNPIAAKKFQDYVKKLKDIDAIDTPSQH
jgi:Ca-activated chloride channel family protein